MSFHTNSERTSMIKTYILPKPPRELRSNIQLMRMVLKLRNILTYYKNVLWPKIMHSTRLGKSISLPPTHLQPCLTMHTFKRFPMVSRQGFSSILVQVCRLHKHLTKIPTNGISVTAHTEFVFERNVSLLHKMFHICLVVNFGVCSPHP